MEKRLAQLMEAMTAYDAGDARRIQHFIKVHDLAATIAAQEEVDGHTAFIIETAAILHDIGIHLSEEKYGSSSGHYQEIEGPAEAEKVINNLGGYSREETERVMWLIGHHHTYSHITDIDHQILVEADFLVNFYEDGAPEHTIRQVHEKVFRTETGRRLLDMMFLAPKWEGGRKEL